jgi:hypothetical protein
MDFTGSGTRIIALDVLVFMRARSMWYFIFACRYLRNLDANLVIHFRRTLRGDNLLRWTAIKDRLRTLILSTDNDFISWSLNQKNSFLQSLFIIGWREIWLVLITSGSGKLKFL